MEKDLNQHNDKEDIKSDEDKALERHNNLKWKNRRRITYIAIFLYTAAIIRIFFAPAELVPNYEGIIGSATAVLIAIISGYFGPAAFDGAIPSLPRRPKILRRRYKQDNISDTDEDESVG